MIPRGLVSTRLRRWYPARCRHNARPRYFEGRTASFRARAPGVSGFRSLAFLRGGITVLALRAAPLVHENMHCRAVDGIVAFACIVGTVHSNAAKLLVCWVLLEKVRQHRCIPDAATRHLYRPYLQCFLVDPNMDFAPKATLGAAMFAGISFAFTLSFDPSSVHKKVQWPR